MKVTVINGSPRGSNGNTNVIIEKFLKGAGDAGAKTVNIQLSEKNINHCMGCHICWTKGPAQCVIIDDMLEIMMHMGDADVIVFASPVQFGNISGMLKVFMDRMTMIGGPGEQQKPAVPADNSSQVKIPKLMMISSCGLDDTKEFDVTSLWINRVAEKVHMDLSGEIYFTKSRCLNENSDLFKDEKQEYFKLLEKAGYEMAAHMKLSPEVKDLLERRGF